MNAPCKRRRKRIGEILLEMGCLSADNLAEALGVQAGLAEKIKLGNVLVSRGWAQQRHVDAALAKQHAST